MKNEFRIDGETTWIKCRHRDGSFTEVPISTTDLELVSSIPGYWHLQNRGYVSTNTEGGKNLYLHHLIMGKPEAGFEIDHINSVPSDNRRANLQQITLQQNRAKRSVNDRPNKNRRGGLPRGVIKLPSGNFQVTVCSQFIGVFPSIEMATERAANYRALVNFQRLILPTVGGA